MKDIFDKWYKGYIITDMELGDSLDNIIFMYEEPLLEIKNKDEKIDKGTDLNP